MNQDQARHWHLDRSVPIAMIVTIATQIVVGVWWISKLDARIERLESFRSEQLSRDDRQDSLTKESINLLRVDVQVLAAKIDRMYDRELSRSKP